jgi:penicillin-binding protein 2
MRLFQPDSRQRRTMGALFAITFAVAVLLTAFFHTQVVSGEQYGLQSEANRLRPVTMPAPRGTIVDRYGEIVATSIPGFSVMLLPGSEEAVLKTLQDLQPFLGLAREDLARLMQDRAGRPHDLLIITEDATFSQVAAIEERRTSFPNLLIVDRPKRFYPSGPAIGHMIGYVSEITREQLELPEYEEAGYRQGRWIGQAGIEKQYEMMLSGSDGARFVEVDAMGRIVNPRSTVQVLPPEPGEELELTLDLGLQEYVADIFPDTMKGALVAMVPSTGEILAMYSNPAYDPNDFVGGIQPRIYNALTADPDKPLLHRAVAAIYPPASTFKLATAAMGLEAGILDADTRMPIPCTGGMAYAGRYARCWYAAGHGSLDLVGAIEKSCNVYFFQVGIRLGFLEFVQSGTRMGFASNPGIDLPSASSGTFPTGVEWWEETMGYPPQPSEVMSLAIGQGPNSQTVLKMAHFYSAIAGNGSAPNPHLAAIEGAGDESGAIKLDLTDSDLQAMWDGLARVVSPGGTGWLSNLERWKVYGKTGTAQNPHGEDHGWFTGFAGLPGQRPEIAVAVIVEYGLHGSDVAPLATKAMNYFLSKKHDVPFEIESTLIERYNNRRCPWGSACVVQTAEQALHPERLQWGAGGRLLNGPAVVPIGDADAVAPPEG